MITIVTITFNNYEELVSTSATIPKDPSVDHLVINGGSCPKTQEFLVQGNFHHLSERDKGISDAFNKGVRHASGDYIMFVNSGDHLLKPDYVFEALRLFKQRPELDFIYSSILFEHSRLGEYEYAGNPETGEMPFPHPSLIVKKSVFDEAGGFSLDYKIAMDFDFAYRLKKLDKKGYFYPHGPVVKMDGKGVSSKKGLEGIRERMAILKKHGFLDFQTRRRLFTMYSKQWVKDRVIGLGLSEDTIDRIRGRK